MSASRSVPEAGVPAASEAWISRSLEATERAGEALAPALASGDVLALSGPLGAGKSRLVAGIARGLGREGAVRSPTFTLINEYPGRVRLIHVDLYRLEGADASGLGLEEQIERGVLAVEWGERLPNAYLAEALALRLEITGEAERRLTAAAGATERARELLAAWRVAADVTLERVR